MVFNYAMRNQWVTRNPAEYVEHARDERPLEERPLDMDVLTPEEAEALREAATPATYRDGKLITNNYRLLISFAIFTGCRVAEILGRPGATSTGRVVSSVFAGRSGKAISTNRRRAPRIE